MAKRSKQLKYGDPGYRHPYMDYEGTPMWRWIWKALHDLVENKDLIEVEDANHIVGYFCKVIANGQKRARMRTRASR